MDNTINLFDLKANNALAFCCNEYDFSNFTEVYVNAHNMNDVPPFGMLLVASKLRSIRQANQHAKFYINGIENKSYAAHMGFFKSFNVGFGKSPGEACGNTNYIPITKLNVKELRIESYNSDNGVVQSVIERKSRELAKVLTRGNLYVEEIVTYSIREIMRNIVEHSTAEEIWFAAQYWSSKDTVEISLLDEGVGIKQAISINPNLVIKKPEDALLLSIEPGISGKAFKYKGRERIQEDSVWRNSGYGLYVTSKLCQLGGDFLICSGEKALHIKGDKHQVVDTNFNGTAIRMRMKVSEIANFKGNLVDEIVSKGEAIAKENGDRANITASKVSRILTQTF
ncbi:ATP-binding protein [Solibacillus cecembensis]|uniref:ATP-binding protein n=1 Tax=Solibacillus cecembensis TaxID=459347 RepID=UPI003D0077C9